jgi:hypothetical protein
VFESWVHAQAGLSIREAALDLVPFALSLACPVLRTVSESLLSP